MGWTINFYMPLPKTTDVVSVYFSLLKHLNNDKSFPSTININCRQNIDYIYNYSDLGKKEFCLDTAMENLSKLVKQYDVEKLYFASYFLLPRLYKFFYNDGAKIEEDTTTGVLYLKGPETGWNPCEQRKDFNLIWEVGDHKNYRPKFLDQTSSMENCMRMIEELKTLISYSNVSEVWGTGEHFDGDSKNIFLVYKKYNMSYSQYPNLNIGDLERIEIIEDSESGNWCYIELEDGEMIYHRKFIEGSLYIFFRYLEILLKRHTGYQAD